MIFGPAKIFLTTIHWGIMVFKPPRVDSRIEVLGLELPP